MKTTTMRLLVLTVLLVCTSCATDPRNQADADATRSQAAQDAADRELARAEKKAQAELKQAEEKAISEQRVKMWQAIIQYATYGAVFTTLALFFGMGKGGFEALKGLGEAAALAAKNKADWVYMDPETMTFPLVPTYIGERRIAIYNPNDNSVIMLDLAQPGDRQKLAILGAQNLAIGVANKAKQHKTDPAGVALVGTNPLAVGVRQEKAGEYFEVGDFSDRMQVEKAEVDDGN